MRHLRRVLRPREIERTTDGKLLTDFLRHRDEGAFETIVRRHGGLVMGVCRRVLANTHDAEDAFQATFLVLIRKASSLASPDLLANWLYGVAYNTALKARAWTAKRRRREQHLTHLPDTEAAERNADERDLWNDLQPLLDQELSRLPDKYRVPIVLCDLEGKSRRQAAQRIGCPEGTVSGRLARARAMLAKRLTRRGLALAGGSLAFVLAENASAASVPSSVVITIVKAAGLHAAGQAATASMVSTKVAALAEGVLKSMMLTKCKIATAVLFIAAALGFSGHGFLQALADEPTQPIAKQEPQEPNGKPAQDDDVGKLTLPQGPMPTQALVSLDDAGQLVVRTREAAYKQFAQGQQLMVVDEIKTRQYKLGEVQVFDVRVEPIDPKQLPKMLAKEVAALIIRGRQPLDPLHFRLHKEGTLVFVIPLPPGPAPPAAAGGFGGGGFAVPLPPAGAVPVRNGVPVLPPPVAPQQALPSAPQRR
ncbi:MAG: sigma-70 family RNA polymerase sigma factor [Planctomycetes bacterium]|nr:sigma-70 family RNA polymerase sigma factor [Planctomycetota bacterium]